MIKISKHIPISYIQEVSFPMIEIHSSVETERTCLLIDLLKPWHYSSKKNHRLHKILNNDEVRLKLPFQTTWLFLLFNVLMKIYKNSAN